MRKRRLEAPLPLLPESPSEGKHGPQRAPRHTPQVGVLAAQECAPLVLRDMASGLPKQGPPWDIEGEPGGRQNLALKRPFEADNEVDTEGQTGHKQIPGHIKMQVSTTAPQTPGHYSPWVCTHHRDAALKPPAIFILRPIKRACGWRRTTCQCVATSTWQHIMPPSHVCHSLCCTACAGQTAPSPSNKAEVFPLLHARC